MVIVRRAVPTNWRHTNVKKKTFDDNFFGSLNNFCLQTHQN